MFGFNIFLNLFLKSLSFQDAVRCMLHWQNHTMKPKGFLFLPDDMTGRIVHFGIVRDALHRMHGTDARHEFIRNTTGRGTYHYGGAGTIWIN